MTSTLDGHPIYHVTFKLPLFTRDTRSNTRKYKGMSIYSATTQANDRSKTVSRFKRLQCWVKATNWKIVNSLATTLSTSVCLIDSLLFAWYSSCDLHDSRHHKKLNNLPILKSKSVLKCMIPTTQTRHVDGAYCRSVTAVIRKLVSVMTLIICQRLRRGDDEKKRKRAWQLHSTILQSLATTNSNIKRVKAE